MNAASVFQLVIAVLTIAAGVYATRVGKRGKDAEAAQQRVATAAAQALADRDQRFKELTTSLAEARKDLAYYAGQVKAARSDAQAVVEGRDMKIVDLERRLSDLEKLNKHLSELEQQLIAEKEAAFEQSDQLAEQLAEERNANRLLAAQLETTRAQLDATLAELAVAREELQAAKQQVTILTEHARRVDQWWVRHYSTNGHTDETDKPPTLTPFDVDGEGA